MECDIVSWIESSVAVCGDLERGTGNGEREGAPSVERANFAVRPRCVPNGSVGIALALGPTRARSLEWRSERRSTRRRRIRALATSIYRPFATRKRPFASLFG